MPVVSAISTNTSGSSGIDGMEERVAAAVGVEPVLEVGPRADRVHGLVLDQLLEQRGRRVPGDAAQLEQADVEQRRELRLQLEVDLGRARSRRRRSIVGIGREPQLVGAQVDEELHAVVEPGEQPEQAGRPAA